MYTVILYWQGETAENVVLDPECYGFLFSYAQVEDQVLRRPYAGAQKEALGHTLTDLNWAVGGRAEWRLLLFDGRLPASGREEQSCLPPPDTIRKEWTPLLRCVSGEELGGDRLEAAAPREVWYLSCSVRGTYSCMGQNRLAYAKVLLDELGCGNPCGGEHGEGRKAAVTAYPALDVINIPSLRMGWVEILPGGGIYRQQEVFRLCCTLLALAHNDISPAILDSGYVYRVSVGLDWERLVGSAGRLCLQSANLAEQFQKAWEYWCWAQQRTTPYVEPANLYAVQSSLPVQPKDRQDHKLEQKELKWGGGAILERKLRVTHQWLYKQLFFPQNDVYKSFNCPIKLEEQNNDIALDAAGQASIQSELDDAIRKFHDRRRQKNSPLQFEQELGDVERRVRDRVEDQLTDAERQPIQKILAALEGVTFAAAVMRLLRRLTQFLEGRFPAFFAAARQRFAWPGWELVGQFLLFLAAAAAVYALTRLMFRGISWYADRRAVSKYNRHLNTALKHRGENRESTFDFIKCILRYRYHWFLQKRQLEIAKSKERQKEYLRHHSAAQKNTAAACALLEQLMEQSGSADSEARELPLPRIDFSKEPEQGDYFWRAAHSQTCGLNGGGYELDVVFDFITEVEIFKTAVPRKI